MQFDYLELLSGEPIKVPDVGHLRSPKLKSIYPGSGIGYEMYNFYLSVLSWTKDSLLKCDRLFGLKGVDRLEAAESLTFFDTITLLKPTRDLLQEVLSFFMVEDLVWVGEKRKYVAVLTDDDEQHVSGEISRKNFESVRTKILQLNFLHLDKDDAVEAHHTSAKSEELWNKAQAYLKKQAEKKTQEDHPEYKLGNVVSKLCTLHPTYNLFNVGELTVFQLYDAFFQLSYMRSVQLSERIFSNHGGDKFNFGDWMKPILKNI